MNKQELSKLLLSRGLLAQAEITAAEGEMAKSECSFTEALVSTGAIGEDALYQLIAEHHNLEWHDLPRNEVPDEVIALVRQETAINLEVIPISFDGSRLTLATASPDRSGLKSNLGFAVTATQDFVFVVASPTAIDDALKLYYNQVDFGTASPQAEAQDEAAPDLSGEVDPNAAPVVKLVNNYLVEAVRARAADLHVEVFARRIAVRCRVDGVLQDLMAPPHNLASSIVARIKVMAQLNITENRVPQDGRIEVNVGGLPIDLRVSTLPTIHGESVVMRILDQSQVKLRLEDLGFAAKQLASVKDLLGRPNGILLVTGPTGSGKTTTLYAGLNRLRSPERKLLTVEDPVEYNIEGVQQVQVNEETGLDFARCLRAFLRQDPDIMLVGEIRDVETASIAIESALTGHLVLSTLHTNDAPLAVTRLLDLGLEPFLIAATLEGIVAQRLVRCICTECKEEYEPLDEELRLLDMSRSDLQEGQGFFRGRGCTACNNTGYRGRTAILEILTVTDKIKDMIVDPDLSTDELREAARAEGLQTLRQSGLEQIAAGVTTLQEVGDATISVL